MANTLDFIFPGHVGQERRGASSIYACAHEAIWMISVKELVRLIEGLDVFYHSFSPSMRERGQYDDFS